jgi:hypothetical protein
MVMLYLEEMYLLFSGVLHSAVLPVEEEERLVIVDKVSVYTSRQPSPKTFSLKSSAA